MHQHQHQQQTPQQTQFQQSLDIYDDGDYRKVGLGVKRTNALLVRKPTGIVKPTTYNLPSEGFTYGRRDQFDDEGVREVVGSWQYHESPPLQIAGRDFVRLNVDAVTHGGATTAQQITSYRATHDYRLRSTSSTRLSSSATDAIPANMTFGKPSLSTTPINDVINNAYQRDWIAEQRALQMKRELQLMKLHQNKQKGSSMHTRASLGHMKVAAAPPPPIFKMAKFANVESRIHLASSFAGSRSGSAPSSLVNPAAVATVINNNNTNNNSTSNYAQQVVDAVAMHDQQQQQQQQQH